MQVENSFSENKNLKQTNVFKSKAHFLVRNRMHPWLLIICIQDAYNASLVLIKTI